MSTTRWIQLDSPIGRLTLVADGPALVALSLPNRGGSPPGRAANGRDPIAIGIPCHRIIGADGTLTGYGGGLPTKRWLLAHEGRQQRLSLTAGSTPAPPAASALPWRGSCVRRWGAP